VGLRRDGGARVTDKPSPELRSQAQSSWQLDLHPTRREIVEESSKIVPLGAPLLESKGFNQSELHPDRLGNTRRSSMSSSHKYFFILQNQHVTDANLTSFYGPQKLSRKRHTLRGPTSTWWHRSHPAQWSRARNLSSSAMLATVAARFVPMGSSRSRDMSSCLWRIAIWPVTRSPERRQARMFIHVTCFKATSYVTHFKSALSFGEGHASRGILRNHGRNNNSPATPRRNAYTTESSETRVPDT